MISQTAEYALRAMVFLADHPEDSCTAESIAEGTKVPVGYLAKIMQGMSKAGLVTSQRGLHGGFKLVKQPDQLTVYDVVQAVDPIERITTCPLGLEGHGTNLCPLHRGLDNAMGAVEMAFKKMTAHQLLNQPKANRPLCNFPKRT
jgi:Rrf2 family transcriptional regulator, nitric oxide-sensitive transcriptional repressor